MLLTPSANGSTSDQPGKQGHAVIDEFLFHSAVEWHAVSSEPDSDFIGFLAEDVRYRFVDVQGNLALGRWRSGRNAFRRVGK
jgi:hypothetical protein